MLKTRIIKVKSIENEEIRAIATKKTITMIKIMKIITIIMKTIRIKIGNRLKYKSVKAE